MEKNIDLKVVENIRKELDLLTEEARVAVLEYCLWVAKVGVI